MSTYFYFHCSEHKVSGGCWTRQAWGLGNADLIDAFKFVMYHVSECGPDSVGIHSEYDDEGWGNTSFEKEHRRQHLEQTAHIFPRSDDWEFMAQIPNGEDFRERWVRDQLAEITEEQS